MTPRAPDVSEDGWRKIAITLIIAVQGESGAFLRSPAKPIRQPNRCEFNYDKTECKTSSDALRIPLPEKDRGVRK